MDADHSLLIGNPGEPVPSVGTGDLKSAWNIYKDIESRHPGKQVATAGRMAATVAHEINNPLEAVTNILFLLEQVPGLDPTAQEFVHSAQEEIARTAQRARKGTGVGLWVSKGIVEKHDGTISVKSSTAPGRSGTVFSIFLPHHSARNSTAV